MKPSIYNAERRDVIAKLNCRSRANYIVRVIGVGLFVGLLAVIACQHLMPVLAAGPSMEKPIVMADGEKGDMTTLCARYRSDHLMTGMKMEGETAALCGFSK